MSCEDGDGDCLRSAYYGIAKYGCSYYGLVMPLLPASLTYGDCGAIAYTFGNQGAIALTFTNEGATSLGFEETQRGG